MELSIISIVLFDFVWPSIETIQFRMEQERENEIPHFSTMHSYLIWLWWISHLSTSNTYACNIPFYIYFIDWSCYFFVCARYLGIHMRCIANIIFRWHRTKVFARYGKVREMSGNGKREALISDCIVIWYTDDVRQLIKFHGYTNYRVEAPSCRPICKYSDNKRNG